MDWVLALFRQITGAMAGTWLVCNPPGYIDLALLTGGASTEATAMLFNDVPLLTQGDGYQAGPDEVDQLIMQLLPPSNESDGAGAQPVPGSDLVAWGGRSAPLRNAVGSAIRASAIRGGMYQYLQVQTSPTGIQDLVATDISVPILSADQMESGTIKAQYSFMSVSRPWLQMSFFEDSDWYWPGHEKFALAGEPDFSGRLEAVSVEVLLLWQAVMRISTGGTISVLSEPPWKSLGYRILQLPASPRQSDPNITLR